MWDAEWMAITIFHDNKDGQIWEWPFFMISHLWTSLLGKIVKSVTFSDSQSGWSTVRFDRSIRPCTGRTSWYDYPFSIAFRSTSISFKYIFRYTSYFWGLVEILTLNSSNHEQFRVILLPTIGRDKKHIHICLILVAIRLSILQIRRNDL